MNDNEPRPPRGGCAFATVLFGAAAWLMFGLWILQMMKDTAQ